MIHPDDQRERGEFVPYWHTTEEDSMASITITAEEIREGDRFVADGFHHWTALSDAFPQGGPGGPPTITVEFADGGREFRAWAAGTEITIEREEA